MAKIKARYKEICELLKIKTRLICIPYEKVAQWRAAPPFVEGLYDASGLEHLQELGQIANEISLWEVKQGGPMVVKLNDHYFPFTPADLRGIEAQRKETRSKNAMVQEIYKRETTEE